MNYLITRWFGTFLFDKKGLKDKIIFPKKIEEISKRLQKIDNNKVLSEEKKITKGKKIIVNEKRLSKLGEYKPNDTFFKNIEIESEKFGFTQDILHKATIYQTKKKINEKLASKDLQIVQMVNALDDLIQTSNLLSERLEIWSMIPTPKEKMQPFINTLDTVKKDIKSIEEKIEKDMNKVAPNIAKIAGLHIGARLIAISGSLERLATMPSSTIQILGAEKALFRYKKEGGKPPKHGVIFQHPFVNRSNKRVRGKISRVLANKISIAAKADAFTQRDISTELKEDLDERVKEIRKL
jgi:nucleolar protein 56